VFPLVKKDGMAELATALYHDLRRQLTCFYDDSGAIGRRYRRMDEAGTPYGVTVDGETTANQTVTIRHRDSMQQERVEVSRVGDYLKQQMKASL
jgi:glycyl-tRNA synthetase